MHLCLLDAAGSVLVDANLPANPDAFLAAIAPFRDGLVVACECMFGWSWLADLPLYQAVLHLYERLGRTPSRAETANLENQGKREMRDP